MSTKNDSDELVWRKVNPATQSAPLMVAGSVRRLSNDASEWHVEPPAGPMSVTPTPPTEKDTHIVVSRAETPETPIAVLGAGEPAILGPGGAVTFRAVPTTKPALRVFRFRDDAWQCPKDAVSCWLRLADGRNPTIIVHGHEGREADHGDSVQAIALACNAEATRLSTWVEWFELTLRKAAHDYLDLSMTLRFGLRLDAAQRSAGVWWGLAGAALAECRSSHWLGTIDGFSKDPYLLRVKADIESRLSGESGSVVRPDSEGE